MDIRPGFVFVLFVTLYVSWFGLLRLPREDTPALRACSDGLLRNLLSIVYFSIALFYRYIAFTAPHDSESASEGPG